MPIMRVRWRSPARRLYTAIGVWALALVAIFASRGPGASGGGERGSDVLKEPVARINGAVLSRGDWERAWRRAQGQMVARARVVGYQAEWISRDRREAFEKAVLEHLVTAEAEREGISVTQGQVSARAREMGRQQLDELKLRFRGEALGEALAQVATQADGQARESMSEEEFLTWSADLVVATQGDGLRADLAAEALRERVTGSVTATEEEFLASCDEVELREILVATRPPGKPERSDEEARERAREMLEEIRGGADFAELALGQSDEEDVRRRRGLEPTWVQQLPPEYREAVGSLKAGEVVGEPIKTERGYVIIKVEERERRLPAGYEESKQQYLNAFLGEKRRAAWEAYMEGLRDGAEVVLLDPEIRAYQELAEGNPEGALVLLKRATATAGEIGGLAAASVYYKLGTVCAAQNRWKEAAEGYTAANGILAGLAGGSEGVLAKACAYQPLVGLGLSYENLGDLEAAVRWYQAAGEATGMPSAHEHLVLTYRRIGREDLAEREEAWIAAYRKQEEEREKAIRE